MSGTELVGRADIEDRQLPGSNQPLRSGHVNQLGRAFLGRLVRLETGLVGVMVATDSDDQQDERANQSQMVTQNFHRWFGQTIIARRNRRAVQARCRKWRRATTSKSADTHPTSIGRNNRAMRRLRRRWKE